MSGPLAEIVEEGRRAYAKRNAIAPAVEDEWQMFILINGPRLLAVAEAVPPLLAYLEEEVLEAKTCEGQDEQTGKPCEWHAILLALDAAVRGAK